ncbi:Alkaline phosphatase synthesis sensor protein PhoR [compost metagenome]
MSGVAPQPPRPDPIAETSEAADDRTAQAISHALAEQFLAIGRPTAWTLGAIYVALASAKGFLYDAPQGVLASLSAVDAAVAATWLLSAAALQRATPADRWPQPLGTLAITVAILDSVLTMHWLFKPLETLVFVLAVMVASLCFTSVRWFATTIMITLACWALAVRLSPSGPIASPGAPWVELGITIVAGAIFATVIFAMRRRAALKLEAARAAEARQRERLEAAMTELQAQHEQVQTLLRFKTDLVNAVSHDLRIPLTSIKGFTELLLDQLGGPLTPTQSGYVGQIEKAAARLERLVEDMLDLARLEAGTFELKQHTLDFGSLVADLADSFRPLAEEAGLSLELALPRSPLLVKMDAERLDRVVANLVSNAIKFTPAGGRIEIRALTTGDQLRCEIVDTGVGIAPDDQPQLFRRFSQLDQGRRIRGGTGLGLSIAKAIVEAHGGHIGVTSETGAGSVFWFTLPRR